MSTRYFFWFNYSSANRDCLCTWMVSECMKKIVVRLAQITDWWNGRDIETMKRCYYYLASTLFGKEERFFAGYTGNEQNYM